LGDEIARACAAPPDCVWETSAAAEPLAPTLARHADPDEYARQSQVDLRAWASQNLPPARGGAAPRVDLLKPGCAASDIVATLLYPVMDRPFRELYELAQSWSVAQRAEVLDL